MHNNQIDWEDIIYENDFEEFTPSDYIDDLIESSLLLTHDEIDEALDELVAYGADIDFCRRFSAYCHATLTPDEGDAIYYYLRVLLEQYVRPEFTGVIEQHAYFVEMLEHVGLHLIKENGLWRLMTSDEMGEYMD